MKVYAQALDLKNNKELINEYENHDRGWYSGPFGWIDQYGDGDFSVSLRSAIVMNKTIQIYSGGGIVKESIPENEWQETELKFKSILSVMNEPCYE